MICPGLQPHFPKPKPEFLKSNRSPLQLPEPTALLVSILKRMPTGLINHTASLSGIPHQVGHCPSRLKLDSGDYLPVRTLSYLGYMCQQSLKLCLFASPDRGRERVSHSQSAAQTAMLLRNHLVKLTLSWHVVPTRWITAQGTLGSFRTLMLDQEGHLPYYSGKETESNTGVLGCKSLNCIALGVIILLGLLHLQNKDFKQYHSSYA